MLLTTLYRPFKKNIRPKMPMRIKSKEWLAFKEQFLNMLSVLGDETENFDFPEDPENFEIFVRECEVHPTFMK
jgi:hypothetical protein